MLPSIHRSESWGAVQLEAMASGVPVVCTELGTGTSYVNRDGETGFVLPPADTPHLSIPLTGFWRPSLRRAMGEKAKKRVESEFSVEQMVKKTAELYLGLSNSTLDF